MSATGRARIHWLDRKTGATGIWEEEPHEWGSVHLDEDGWDPFMWSEGNYSCDHNRIPLFLHSDEDIDLCGTMPDGSVRMRIMKIEAQRKDSDEWELLSYTEVR